MLKKFYSGTYILVEEEVEQGGKIKLTNANIVLNKSQLLAFLVKPSNGFSEHYVSSQPLNLYIPYTEYVTLIGELVGSNFNYLKESIDVYRKNLGNHNSLYRLFCLDVAKAGFTEVSKSMSDEYESTKILAKYDEIIRPRYTVKDISISETSSVFMEQFTEAERKDLIKHIESNIDIVFSEVLKKVNNISNINMFLLSAIYYGIYLFDKRIILNIKED